MTFRDAIGRDLGEPRWCPSNIRFWDAASRIRTAPEDRFRAQRRYKRDDNCNCERGRVARGLARPEWLQVGGVPREVRPQGLLPHKRD
jgi:hypothetical protein